jgi:hypothetical protein
VLKITNLHINVLKCEDKKQIEEVKVKVKNEMLSQCFVHSIDEIPIKAFAKKLADRETYQNWRIKPIPIVLKK